MEHFQEFVLIEPDYPIGKKLGKVCDEKSQKGMNCTKEIVSTPEVNSTQKEESITVFPKAFFLVRSRKLRGSEKKQSRTFLTHHDDINILEHHLPSSATS